MSISQLIAIRALLDRGFVINNLRWEGREICFSTANGGDFAIDRNGDLYRVPSGRVFVASRNDLRNTHDCEVRL
jgi:hypothetical protein